MQTDYVQRFLFENLDIRGRLVCLTGAWQRMLDGRGYPEDIAALLGHTTALNVLLGANQKGSGRVTLQVQGSGPVKLLVSDCTAELRIRGMMIGIDLKMSGTPAVSRCMERGVLINCTHDTVIRLLPAMNITAEQVDEGCRVIADVLREMK